MKQLKRKTIKKLLTRKFLYQEYIMNKKNSYQIAKMVGCSNVTILKYLRIHSIKIRTFAEAALKGMLSPSAKYKLNQNYFESINTKEKAYWLGFLTADAGIIYDGHRLQLDLAIKDEYHVLKFRKSLKSNHKLFYVLHNKKYKSAMLSITNLKLFTDLTKIFSRTKMPLIDNKLISHFIRGVFDGNGCIMYIKDYKSPRFYGRVSLLGEQSFLEDLKTKLMSPCNNKTTEIGGIYELRLYGGYVFKFMDWIYEGSTDKIRLTRKFQKYRGILTQKKEQERLCQI